MPVLLDGLRTVSITFVLIAHFRSSHRSPTIAPVGLAGQSEAASRG